MGAAKTGSKNSPKLAGRYAEYAREAASKADERQQFRDYVDYARQAESKADARRGKRRWKLMAKNKMPPELLEHFKKKEAKKEDGTEMSDKEKRKAALEKARKYKEQKGKKADK